MKTLNDISVLFYYDGPQIFEARDEIGGHYIGVMIEPDGQKERYLVAAIEPDRLRRFRLGILDLRTLLTDRSIEDWFFTIADTGLNAGMSAQAGEGRIADLPFLPEPGFFLHERPAADTAVKEARARNNLVLEIAVDPPEAAYQHRIRTRTLIGLLSHVQTLVKHAYGAAVRELSLSVRRSVDRSEAHLMDVIVPAATGSFRIVMEAAGSPDLLGQSELARALRRIDVLFEKCSKPEEAAEIVRANRGHLAGSYLRLLRFLIQHNMGLRYSWAEPSFPEARSRSITEGEAAPLIALLSGIANLGSEAVSLVGTLEEADVTKRTWRLATPDGKYCGQVKGGGPSLEGLKLGSSYHFSCVEEIEEHEGSGREQRSLYLMEHRPA